MSMVGVLTFPTYMREERLRCSLGSSQGRLAKLRYQPGLSVVPTKESQLVTGQLADAAAKRNGLTIRFRYAESNPMLLIHYLFESIHAKSGPAPDAILVESMTSGDSGRSEGMTAGREPVASTA